MAIKVGWVCGDRSGPWYHDIGVPLKYFHKYNLLECECFDVISVDMMMKKDLIFFQRQYAVESLNTIKALRRLKESGVASIAHVDDNVWELQPNNPAFSTYMGDTLKRFEEILAEADAVTTSTPYLKSLCIKHNPNTHIFRNLVETEIERFPSPGRDKPEEIRIGWTSTPHHHDDYITIELALRDVVRKYPQVKLVFMGYIPPSVIKDIPRNRYEYYAFVKTEFFYHSFANLDFDIGIAPLTDHPFNWGKTARKAQEYAILHIPMALANVRTYNEWKHEEVCLKPYRNRYMGWVEVLSRLIESKELRETLANNAYKQVIDNHSIDNYIFERAQVFSDTCERIRNGKAKA